MALAGYKTKILTVQVPDPTADLTIAAMIAPDIGLTVHNVYASCQTAVAAHATNIVTCSLIDGGTDGTGTTEVAVRTGGASVGWDANEFHELTLSNSATDVGFDAGDHVLVKYDEGGTVAPGYVTFQINYSVGGS